MGVSSAASSAAVVAASNSFRRGVYHIAISAPTASSDATATSTEGIDIPTCAAT